MSNIVSVPKKAKVTELNYYRPVALTSVTMKCFERLVKDHITDTLDPLQFAYRPNRSADNATTLENNLTLNINKTKEMMDFRKQQREHRPYPHRRVSSEG